MKSAFVLALDRKQVGQLDNDSGVIRTCKDIGLGIIVDIAKAIVVTSFKVEVTDSGA